MKQGIFCYFLFAVFLTGGIDGGNVGECSEDLIKEVNIHSNLLFTFLEGIKPNFTAMDDLLSKICEKPMFKGIANELVDKLSKCPDILNKTQIATMKYGPFAFVDGFEKELSKGFEYFCGCSPYIMSGLVMNGLRKKSAFVIEDPGMFQFISNISAYCAEIHDETVGKISIPSVVRKVLNSHYKCPEILRLAGLNSSKTQSFLTDLIDTCDTYNPDEFQCALEKSRPAEFTTCVYKYESENNPCRKVGCVERVIQRPCGGSSGQNYMSAVNLLNGREGFRPNECNYESPEPSCATDEKIAEVNKKIEMLEQLSGMVRGFEGLNGILSASCEEKLLSWHIKKYVDIFRKCPDLVGRSKLTNVTFGFLRFGESFEKLATKGYQYLCDCSPYLLSTLVLNGLKGLQNISRVTGVFPTVANISFYCDEIHDDKLGGLDISSIFRTVLSGEGKCPELLSLAGIKSKELAPDITRVLDQCPQYKPDEFKCTLDPSAMTMVKECNDSLGDQQNTCSFYNCVVANMTRKCGSNGTRNYVSAVNIVAGPLTFNMDKCGWPSSGIQFHSNGFLVLCLIVAIKLLS